MMGNVKKNALNTANGNVSTQNTVKSTAGSTSRSRKQKEREERERLVIWKQPIKTLEYFTKEVFVLLYTYGKK